ncbi:MAG: HipA domain-containing protein [Myxococcales bacterium]|nr:HipA domain-containing protein [Myxococcales bacterium]
MQPTPLAIVREDGKVEELGAWHPKERLLELFVPGFPFLGPGKHTLESDLPWLLYDMSPSGFMGAQFARRFPELQLPENTKHWSAPHCLRAISMRGEDLTGNVLVGESRSQFERLLESTRAGEQTQLDVTALIEQLLTSTSAGSSSVGGERPKVILHAFTGSAFLEAIVKYTPPLSTPVGRRWRNLLVMEALVGQCLVASGYRHALGGAGVLGDHERSTLSSPRFDRTPAGGRIGAATLSWLAASRGEAERSGPEVLKSLHRDGLIDQASVTTAELVHEFSRAIGNTDAHLGNYGLVFDAVGTATLAPIYDVSPMVFAPRHDELPDAWVKPRSTPIRPDVVPLVESLVRLARASTDVDPDFLDRWLRYVGA